MAESDVWRNVEDAAASNASSSRGDGARLFDVEKITGVKPLVQTVGGDAADVPEALTEALYGRAREDKRPLKTFAVIDAGKVFGLRERLEASGLPHRCLYIGAGAEAYGDVAPWLVELDRSNAFARALFQHSPDNPSPHHMWEANPGIFVRSAATLDALFTHFRKYTKLIDTQGSWYFFRFWESVTWDALVTLEGTDPEIVARLLGPNTVVFRSVTSFADGTFVAVRGRG